MIHDAADAEEIVADAFAQAWRSAATADSDGLALPVASPADAPDRSAERLEARRLVGDSLRGLPEPQRGVIEMADFDGFSQSEIAAELEQPLGTVKTRMRAGMQKLRETLRPLRPEVEQ